MEIQHTPQIPEFRAPEQGRMQRLAMRAAGMLMQADTPHATLERLAVDVGGYEAVDDTSSGDTVYKANIKPGIKMSLSDETTESRPMQRYDSAADFHDASGTNLEQAAARTINRVRGNGVHARTLRGRTARRLTSYATHKGTTVPDLLRK